MSAGSSLLRDTLRAITWRHAIATLAIGLCVGIVQMTTSRAIFLFLKDNWEQRSYMLREHLGFGELAAFVFMLCLVGADQAVRRGATRGLAYGIAMLVASVLYATIDWSIRWYVLDWFSQPFIQPWFKKSAPVDIFINTALTGSLATLVYADWQQGRATAARLHAATMERTQAAREILREQLHAMQARVDPQWLFDVLEKVKRYYGKDHGLGERTLDDLIRYLRNAMPRLRTRATTLASEAELARSFVAIVNDCSEHKMRFECELKDALGAATVPPMLLLPITRCALLFSGAVAADRNVLTIDAGYGAGRLRITVAHGGGVFIQRAAETALAPIRERLHAYFQDEALFEVRGHSDGASQVAMEIPYEQA